MALSLSSSLIKAGNRLPPATPGKPKKATTFQEFESITSDAWDVGDDDDELLAMAAQNLNIDVVMETANKVNNQMQWLKHLTIARFFCHRGLVERQMPYPL